jgi:hypothetical protein
MIIKIFTEKRRLTERKREARERKKKKRRGEERHVEVKV